MGDQQERNALPRLLLNGGVSATCERREREPGRGGAHHPTKIGCLRPKAAATAA